MSKHNLFISISIAVLTLLFAVASFALYLSKNKSKFWTSKKMKLGAIILSLTAMMSMYSCTRDSDTNSVTRSCYMVLLDYIHLDENIQTLNLKKKSQLSGVISNRTLDEFSFKLQNDSLESVSQTNDIFAADGEYDEETEEFTINIDSDLESGDYTLKFYSNKKENINEDIYAVNQYKFYIYN